MHEIAVDGGWVAKGGRAPALPWIDTLVEERAAAAVGSRRPADAAAEANHVSVEGVSFPRGEERAHCLEGFHRRRAVAHKPQVVAHPVNVRIDRKDVPPQREQEY